MKLSRLFATAFFFPAALLIASCAGSKKPAEPAAAPVLTPRQEASLSGPKKRVGIF